MLNINYFVEYMSFDVSWFTTPSGIMITIGTILLLVGLILYILSGKKDKGENSTVTPEESKAEATPETTETVSAASADANANVVEESPQPVDVVVPEAESQAQVEVPVASEPAPGVENPTIEPVAPVVAEPNVVTPEVAPAVEVDQPAVNIAPSAPSKSEPQVTLEPAVTPVVETPEVKTEENTVSIYGGASPQVSVTPVEEPRKAYGGADPLENTGALPRVEVPVEPVIEPAAPVEVPVASEPVPVVENTTATGEVKVDEKKPVTPTDDVETLEF